jgi:hypothetical protein
MKSCLSCTAASYISTIDSPKLTSRESNGKATAVIGPQKFKGYPKAGPRKNNKKGRAKGKTMILTDIPGKDGIEKRAAKKKEREISGLKRRSFSSKRRKKVDYY